MRSAKLASGILLLAGVVFAGSALAEPGHADRKAAIDEIVRSYVEGKKPKVVGLVVGVIEGGERRVYGYGSVDMDRGDVPDGRTIFEVGSISKAFTGTLLAIAAERGEVALNDPLTRHLPDHVRIKELKREPVTLLDLATHTADFPRVPPNFDPKDWDNPYASYTQEKLFEFLDDRRLDHKKGTGYKYSNLGMGCLGHVLGLKAGSYYEGILIERICEPLGLSDTRVRLNAEQESRFAAAYEKYGKRAKHWDFDALAGAGGVRSTADDMLRFLDANMERDQEFRLVAQGPAQVDEHMTRAFRAARKERVHVNGLIHIGLAWHLRIPEDEPRAVMHNGQTAGHHAFAAFHPEEGSGVVVLANTAYDIDPIGIEIMKLLAQNVSAKEEEVIE